MNTAFTADERSASLLDLAAALREYHAAMNGSRYDDGERLFARARRLEDAYFGRLPRVAMGACPFDGEPLIRTFDPFGFDGPWWRPDAAPTEVPPCPHFCCLRGAVGFNGHRPRGGDFDAHTGPEVPYVIPRILEKPGVVAVVSRVDMTPGHVAYVIAYFAQRRPPVQELAADWPRTQFCYTTALAEHRWRAEDGEEAWDFDLAPWLARGKIRWRHPGDNTPLARESEPGCPYLDLPGGRQRTVVRRDRVWGLGPAAIVD
jgi:hypothetical protein